MAFSYSIRRLGLGGGLFVDLGSRDTVVVVGPNNSGKTTLLREISESLTGEIGERGAVIVASVEAEAIGTVAEFVSWVEDRAPRVGPANENSIHRGLDFEVAHDEIEGLFPSSVPIRRKISPLLFTLLDTSSRLDTVLEAPAIHPIREKPTQPLQLLQVQPKIEKRLSESFRRAFGTPLSLNRSAMKTLSLVIGDTGPESGEDASSVAYARRVNALPTLDLQGDGMKSFIVTALSTITGVPIGLVDEPEAFLHPPQARLIGSVLAARDGGQMFVATHSGEVVRGMLDSEKTVRILRITRDAGRVAVMELAAAEVRTMWDDPVLRFSNLLDGIFHDLVILCESDADCRFYRAILDAISEPGTPIPMFVPCGGKDRMHIAIRALNAVGVRTRVICDFDVLRDESALKKIVLAMDGDWNLVSTLRSSVASSIASSSPPLDVAEISKRIAQLLAAPPTKTEKFKESIDNIFRSASPWSIAKRTGLSSIPNGQESGQASELLNRLATAGVFVVPVGELERFVPSVPGHGPTWIAEVATRAADFASAGEFLAAREFVGRVIGMAQHVPAGSPSTPSPARRRRRATGRFGSWLQRTRNRRAMSSLLAIVLGEVALQKGAKIMPGMFTNAIGILMTLGILAGLWVVSNRPTEDALTAATR